MPKPVPFRLDHAASANLSDQLADGLRDAIVSGYYRKGDILPTIIQLAKMLGTSVQVPRTAIATLASENLISTRRGVGCIVVGRRQPVWKGRILGIVPAERESAYHATTFFGEMRRALTAAGYLFDVVTLDRRPGGLPDWGPLDTALRRNLDLAFPLHCPTIVKRRLERAGIPFATKQTQADSGLSGPQIGDISQFLKQCRAAKVRRVLVVGLGPEEVFNGFCARFSDAGLSVEQALVRCNLGPGYLERLGHHGMALLLERFAKPRETWPQLVFWADDFLAFGGLTGLMERGVSIPRDVFAVTIANKGFLPAYPRTLARFEFDPAATARAAAAEILRRLAGEPPRPIPEVVRYVSGDTLPHGTRP
jgi:DNA-binding transcriptional regulator YhcF (GntR family)